MKCISCGSENMQSHTGAYRYDIGIEEKIVLLGIPINRCPDCGEEEIGIPRLAELHQIVAETIASKSARLTPKEVRFLRKHLDMTNVRLAEIMGVAPETASRWQSEKGPQMGVVAERLLRLLILKEKGSDVLHKTANTPSKPIKTRLQTVNNHWQTEAA